MIAIDEPSTEVALLLANEATLLDELDEHRRFFALTVDFFAAVELRKGGRASRLMNLLHDQADLILKRLQDERG